MPGARTTLKLRTYTIVADAIERGIDCGLSRAYKHSDERISDTRRAQILDSVARAIMEQLDEVIEWGDGDDREGGGLERW